MLDILVQSRRDQQAAERFLRQVVDGIGYESRVVITDNLANYSPAIRKVLPNGYVVNTSFSVNSPHPASVKSEEIIQNQMAPTIGDRLSAAGVTWAWYSGGWNDAISGNPHPGFQFHHQPFIYFADFADGTEERAAHLLDEDDFLAALQDGTLPSVSFFKPIGLDNEHPSYTTVARGQDHMMSMVNAVQASQYWRTTAIIIIYDKNGGARDHIAPPVVDRWGRVHGYLP